MDIYEYSEREEHLPPSDPTNTVGAFSTLSPDDGNISGFWNIVFCLESYKTEKKKASDIKCNLPPSKSCIVEYNVLYYAEYLYLRARFVCSFVVILL
jgi:hypothetical protein